MRNPTSKKIRLAFVVFSTVLCLLIEAQAVMGQQIGVAERLYELRRLRDQLQLSNPLRDSDITVILNERVISEAAQQLVGLEFLLSNGNALRLTSIESDLKAAAAVFKIGIQAKSSVTVNLQLIARINSGELEKGALRLPLRVTEVKLKNGGLSSLFLKTFVGEWLNPKKWNNELPAIEIPMGIAETMRVPSGRFEVAGELPMEISTPDYQAPLKFTVTSLLALDKRVVVALRLDQGEAATAIPASFASVNDNDPMALEDEIARMSEGLNSVGDLRAVLSRRMINALLAQMTAAHNADFNILLKRGRIRSEAVNVIVNVTNYTDVEGGEGRADITQLNVERIADGKLTLRLSGQGEVDARLRGREYGVPYTISPRMTFSIKDQPLPLEFVGEEKKIFLRAAPGSTLPIDVRFNLKVAGRDVGFDRKSVAQADKWLNRIELPSFFDREISLPRKMEIDAGGNLHVTERRNLGYALSDMRFGAKDDAVEIIANVKLNPPK
jgi:hypothetical protein